MAVHIFVVNEANYDICFHKGIVGLPEPKESRNEGSIFDALLSRMACIKENDYILMYITGSMILKGVWKADGYPFYDTERIWDDKIYPFRCRIKTTDFCFENTLRLNDINDLLNSNKIWTWALRRPSGSNAMFAISDQEFEILINEYLKINPFSLNQWRILAPYPFHDSNVIEHIHMDGSMPKYEYSVMTYLNHGFSTGCFKPIFGNYTDHLCYVPTNLGKEMDILLMYGHPQNKNQILSYDIVEVKRDKFDEKALTQLIGYESWFLQKKVSGDMNMLRTTAIAKSFSPDVIDYVSKRKKFENKTVKLIKYSCDNDRNFKLECIFK